jgi:acyl-CoA synthetase (AMP-forming)/AMP-acid ligase II/aryl carrier-like protein
MSANQGTFKELVGLHAKSNQTAICAPGRGNLSFADLVQQIDYTRRWMNDCGVGRGHRVAVVLPNGPEMATSFLSIAAMATCAPLNPAYKDPEFEFYLKDLDVRAVIVPEGVDSPVRAVAARLKKNVIELVIDKSSPAGRFTLRGKTGFAAVAEERCEGKDIGLILHTSGTTSRPKMVPLSQANMCASAKHISETLSLSASDRCLNVMPLYHIHGLMAAVLSSMRVGASVVCNSGFEANTFFKAIQDFKPTWYTAVPTIHQAVLGAAPGFQEIIKQNRFRFIRSSSSSLPSIVMTELESAMGAPVIEAYGMTEASHQMSCNPLPPKQRKPRSVGLPAGPKVAVMDTNGTLLGAGKIGEVVIQGPNVTLGYESNPEANKTAFEFGWFHTGDQGYMDEDGYLYLKGRIKEQINRAGEKISPLEIDEVMLAHPSVSQAVTFAIPHPTLGEDVGAAVVLKKGAQADEKILRAHVEERVAEFKIPQRILIVNELPKGATGKLQRIGLHKHFESQLSSHSRGKGNSDLERKLVLIWSDVLKNPQVGVADNFFSLGGDSLQAVSIVSKAKKAGIDLTVEQLVNHPTIAELAQEIGKAS